MIKYIQEKMLDSDLDIELPINLPVKNYQASQKGKIKEE